MYSEKSGTANVSGESGNFRLNIFSGKDVFEVFVAASGID